MPKPASLATPVNWPEFVRVHQASASLEEVAQKLNISPSLAQSRANIARKKGVALKKFPRAAASRVDWKALNEFAGACEASACETAA